MRVIVTGAASGIGRAVALGLAQRPRSAEPVRLVLVDRDSPALEAVCAELESPAIEILPKVADLANPDVPAQIVADTERAFGGLDAIVSNAGVLKGGLLKSLSLESYEQQFAINTRPTWLFGKAAHGLLKLSRGAIVATASMSSENPTPPLGAYAASKAALVMLVRQMALEWGPDGIRCNCVSPGPTLTPMTRAGYSNETMKAEREAKIPLQRIGTPEDVANAILFLMSPAAAYITGQNLMIDGGLTTSLMTLTGAGSGHK